MLSGAFVAAGISNGVINANPIIAMFVIPFVAMGAIGLGSVAYVAVRALSEWPMRLEAASLGVALGTSTLIGVMFGFFPARRAARLDPIQALGRE